MTPQFALAPGPAANGTARGYFEETVPAGDSAEDLVLFENRGSAERRIKVGVTTGMTALNSGSAHGALSGRCSAPACWVTGIPAIVTLASHTVEELRFAVTIPRGAAPGQYLAGITGEPAQTPMPIHVGGNKNSTGNVIIRITIGVAVTVGDFSRLKTKIVITGAAAGWVDGIPRLSIHVHNGGQRFTKGAGLSSASSAPPGRPSP